MPNCERGVGQGWRSLVDGGEIEYNQHPVTAGGARAAQEEPSRTAAAAAKVVAAGAVAAGRGHALP